MDIQFVVNTFSLIFVFISCVELGNCVPMFGKEHIHIKLHVPKKLANHMIGYRNHHRHNHYTWNKDIQLKKLIPIQYEYYTPTHHVNIYKLVEASHSITPDTYNTNEIPKRENQISSIQIVDSKDKSKSHEYASYADASNIYNSPLNAPQIDEIIKMAETKASEIANCYKKQRLKHEIQQNYQQNNKNLYLRSQHNSYGIFPMKSNLPFNNDNNYGNEEDILAAVIATENDNGDQNKSININSNTPIQSDNVLSPNESTSAWPEPEHKNNAAETYMGYNSYNAEHVQGLGSGGYRYPSTPYK